MRIVSYNILDGGEGRADPLAEVIEAQRPDVVALVEAVNLSVLERIANRLGMDYVQAPGDDQASALLTRWTIRESINHALIRPGLSKSLLEAMLIDPTGAQWSAGVVHLHHDALEADEDQRLRELDVVLDVFSRHRAAGLPHFIAGDFNAVSPVQQIDPDKCKPRTREHWKQNGGMIPRRAIQKVLDAGYTDTLHAARPEQARTLGTFTTQFPGQRVDFILVYGVGPARIVDAWVEQDRLAKYASDHYPVGAQID